MTSAGKLALVGSGEYLPVMQEIEGWLLEDRPRRYVQLATAAAPEGDRVLRAWHELGAQAAMRLDAEQVIIDVRDRAGADDPSLAALVRGAGLIYLSGGNPSHLARTLRGTRVWAAIESEWRDGASLAGCSAGAMALGGYVPDFRHPRHGGVDGLGVIPELRVLPHFDKYSRMIPDFVMRPLVTDNAYVVGVDEDTALTSSGPSEDGLWEFRSQGRQSAWRIEADRKHRVNAPLRLRVNA